MQEILTKAGCFIAIILMGYLLRKKGFFKEGDFQIFSRIVLKITLPASIVASFAGKEIDASMLSISALGLGFGLVYMTVMYVLNCRSSRERQAFEVLNCSGYNIGNFALPFVQSFLGPVGVITTSLFDTGNAFICLGLSYSAASAIKGGEGGFPIKNMVRSLLKSLPFDCYIIMTVLSMARISLPAPVQSFAATIGNANVFMAMLMIGVGFKLSGDRKQLGTIVRILSVRYGLAIAASLLCYFLLPFPMEVRQALSILVFSPIGSAAPAFTADLKGDVGLASAVNSISIICSIICMVTVLSIVL